MPDEPESSVDAAAEELEETEEGVRTTVQRTGPCECVIHIEADAEHLSEKYKEELTSLQAEVQLPGFRRGRAPVGLVERRMGSSLREDLITTLLADAYEEAVAEHELRVVQEPEGPDFEEIDWEPGQPLEHEFRCDVLPRVELQESDYKGLEVDVPRLEVTDEMIEGELERFASQFATWEEVSDEGVDWDDYVEAEVSLADEDWSEEVGFHPRSEEIGPFQVEGVKGALLGARAGDEIELDARVDPDLIEGEAEVLEGLLGQMVRIRVEIQQVTRHSVPEVDDDLAAKLGLNSADEIHSIVNRRLETMVEQRQEELLDEMLRRALVEAVELPLPESLVEDASQRQHTRRLVQLLRSGEPRAEAEERAAEEADMRREAVEFSLRSSFLLREIAEQERILVTESEVEEQVRAFAAQQGWRPEKARAYLEEGGMLRSLRTDMRESKTLAFLKENAEIKELTPEEFNARYGGDEPAAAEQAPGE